MNNNPKLRFKKKNGTDYPDWTSIILGEYIQENNERNKKLLYKNVCSVNNRLGFIKQAEQFENRIVASKDLSNYKVIQKDTYVYNPSRINVGSIARNETNDIGIVSPMYVSFSILDKIKVNFFDVFMDTFMFKNKVDTNTSGSVRDSLNFNNLKKFIINIPSLEEQEQIANFFTHLDSQIDDTNNTLEQLKTYKKNMLQKMFSESGNPEVRFKAKKGGDYPDWEFLKLGDAANINPSNNGLPNEFIYIDLESVTNGIFTPNHPIYLENAPSRAQRLLQNDDIIFQTVRPYQRNNLYFNLQRENTLPYVASTGYAQIRAKINPMCLYQYLYYDLFVKNILEYCVGTNYPAINSTDLSDIQICLPIALEEQEQIADFLSSVDNQIDDTNNKLKQLKTYKKSMLQRMFV